MKITTITRSTASTIKNRLEGAMKSILEELGLELTWGRGTFNDKNYDMKISVHVKSSDAEGDFDENSRMATDFEQRAIRYGLKRTDLGKKFRKPNSRQPMLRGVLQVIGAKPKNRKYPIIIATEGGTHFKFSPEDVRAGLADNPVS